LYSSIIVGGRLSTLFRVSLHQLIKPCDLNDASTNYRPNFLPHPKIRLKTVPDTDDILMLPHTNRTPADFRIMHPIFRLWWISIITTSALVELIAYDSHHEIFPKAICYPLSETNDPFSTGEIQRVLPHRLAHTGVEEEVICGGLEH